MNVSLTPELERFVRSEVKGGLYGNASEVVRDALRGLIAQRRAANPEPPTPPSKEEVRAAIAGMEKEIRGMGVTSLGIFGSVARGEQEPGSDVDVMIEYAPDAGFSLFTLMDLEERLGEKLGCPVDVVSRKSLKGAFGEEALRDIERVF